jgi:hypothetical protein
MKAKRKNPWADRKAYPTPVWSRSGCKVSWNYYKTMKEAQECAKAARHNADIAAGQGYDFGYCAPGEIRQMDPDSWWNEGFGRDVKRVEVGGLYEVCLP